MQRSALIIFALCWCTFSLAKPAEQAHATTLDSDAHKQYPFIFHLVQKANWDAVLSSHGGIYYPPTYQQDGFTHATANPNYLLTIGNHFYRETKGEWLLLKMTVQSLASTGVNTVFEGTAPVGDKQADFDGAKSELFPHILGGISPKAVLEVMKVSRSESGEFTEIVWGQ